MVLKLVAGVLALVMGGAMAVLAHASEPPDVRVPLNTTETTYTPGYLGGLGPGDDPAFYLDAGDHLPTIGPGRFGNAFTFDGSNQQGLDYRTPSGDAANHLSPSTKLTVAAWVKATNPGGSRPIVQLGVRGCGGVGAWSLRTDPSGGLEFYVTNSERGTQNVVSAPAIPAAQIWDGQWHAVAGIYDGGPRGRHVISLWIDGDQASAADFGTTNDEINYDGLTDPDLLVARTSDHVRSCLPAPRGFAGSVDEVEIFDNALSARQLDQLQNPDATSPPEPDDDDNAIPQPTMSGTPKVGEQLSCNDNADLTSVTYTWERAPRSTHFENDRNWFAIDGATGSKYTVQADDAGSRVRCHVYGQAYDDTGGGYRYAERASTSLRADNDVPINTSPAYISGSPVTKKTLTCHTGTWANDPEEAAGDFHYQWYRDGEPIASAQTATYTLRPTYHYRTHKLIDADGDGGHVITCTVFARNDVGSGDPAPSANPQHAVDGKPYYTGGGEASLIFDKKGDYDPLHARVYCYEGHWRDAYAQYGIPGYDWKFAWYRETADGSSTLIPGETGPNYRIRPEDLGRGIRCRVSTANVIGASGYFSIDKVYVPLPQGPVDATMYRQDGHNGADPTSFLPVSRQYEDRLHQLVYNHLKDGVELARQQCRDGKDLKGKAIPDGAPDPERVQKAIRISPLLRCQILLHVPIQDGYQKEAISIYWVGGVRYHWVGHCTVIPNEAKNGTKLCRSLRIQIPSVDPTHPPSTGDDVKALEPYQPKEIIWDIDGNGTADAICPGSAPVMRTILSPGKWAPRAILVGQDSTSSASFHFAGGANSPNPQDKFNTSTHDDAPPGTLRDNQVRVCGTSFDPPPNPAQGPCVTDGQLGRVHVQGNLCPVDVRALDKADYEDLLGGDQFKQLRDFLLAASEDRLKNEPGVTQTHSVRGPPEAETVWAPWGGPSAPRDAVPRDATATYQNTVAALSAYQSPGGFTPPSTPNVNDVKGFVDENAGFALNQIYVARDPVGLNGVTQVPRNGSGALLVPSSVGEALPSTHSMVLAARDAASHLGPPGVDGLPLALGGELNTTLSDVPHSPDDVLRETNLTDVANQLRDEARKKGGEEAQKLLDKLDLGPFNLAGAAKIHANDDGTASIEAKVELPALSVGEKGTDKMQIDARLFADTQGHIVLQGVHLGPVNAYLGALNLDGMVLDYDNTRGFAVKGNILIAGQGLAVNNFQIDTRGHFQALDVDYVAGPGGGITVAPGMLLTTLGGKLDLPNDTIGAHTVLSMGPSPGGGCPTAGLDGHADLHFAHPLTFDARSDVSIACLKIGNVTFHADENGLITVDASAHVPPPDIGPIYFNGHIGGALRATRHAAWQVTGGGSGGIHGVLKGEVEAALSNAGLGACGTIETEIPLSGKIKKFFGGKDKNEVIRISGGAAVDFDDDVPPLNTLQLLKNLHLFVGCDISGYRTVTHAVAPRSVTAAGGFAFTLPRHQGATLLSIEGAGSAPRVRLRSPNGKVWDFSTATGEKGHSAGHEAWGKILESEDRTVVIVGDPAGGTWTATPVAGSRVIRVRQAAILPKPKLKARVSGRGARRTLSYSAAPIPGQVVRFFEFVRGGQKLIKTVRRGGHGKVRFLVSEAKGTRRTIVAEIEQDGLPRGNRVLAHYTARSPKVGRPRHLRVRRRGHTAIVTWRKASLGERYEVVAHYGDGRQLLLFPARGGRARRMVVRRLGRREGLAIRVRTISVGGRPGPYAHARLRGNMHVGRVHRLPKHKHRRKPRKHRHHR